MDDAHLQELRQRAPGLAAIYQTGRDTILRSADMAALEQARVQTLGRKSPLTEFLRSIPGLPAEERPLVGKGGNLIRKELEALVEEREADLKRAALSASLATERIDVTLPGQLFPAGHEHLISQTMREVEDIFIGLGYRIAEGPEVELDYYNFTALNTPPSHPARSAHDTFWVVEQRETMPEAVVDAGAVRFRPMLLTAAAVVVGAGVILFDPIFQGLAISLMAGEVASLLFSRMTVPILYFLDKRWEFAHGAPGGDGASPG